MKTRFRHPFSRVAPPLSPLPAFRYPERSAYLAIPKPEPIPHLFHTPNRFRGIVSPIENPKHGDHGWLGTDLVIYNSKWSLTGWYYQSAYQCLKVLCEVSYDHRVMRDYPPDYRVTHEIVPFQFGGALPDPSRKKKPRFRRGKFARAGNR